MTEHPKELLNRMVALINTERTDDEEVELTKILADMGFEPAAGLGFSRYVVVQNGLVVRRADCAGAHHAFHALAPDSDNGEVLYIKVGGQ